MSNVGDLVLSALLMHDGIILSIYRRSISASFSVLASDVALVIFTTHLKSAVLHLPSSWQGISDLSE
jgi:hypothetical protein